MSMTAGQRWSSEGPKVSGWYWWRNNGEAEIVHVIDQDLADIVLLCGDSRVFSAARMIGHGAGEWCGPLEPPHDQEAG